MKELSGRCEGHHVRQVSFDALTEGVVPTVGIVKASGQGGTYELTSVSRKGAVCQPGRPLSFRDASRLRLLYREGKFERIGDRIAVAATVPFAPFLALGVLLSLALAGSPVIPVSRAALWVIERAVAK